MKEELDGVLEKVTLDNLTADEQEYIDGRDQCRNHTLNIRFNDTEWEHICKQADLLKMRKCPLPDKIDTKKDTKVE